MKNLNFFEKLWEHSRTLRRVGLVLVMCLTTITQVWADDFSASEMVANTGSGTPKNHVTVKAANTTTASQKVCNSNSQTVVQISSNANSSYNGGNSYIEIKADAGYTISSPITITGNRGSTTTATTAIVFWSGDAGSSYDSHTTATLPSNAATSGCGVDVTVPAGTKTIRIYKKITVKNYSFSSDKDATTVGDGATEYYKTITASASAAAKMIYLKNSMGWSNAYVTLQGTGGYWNDNGSGSEGKTTYTMSYDSGKKVFYVEVPAASNDTYICFTKDKQEGYGNFWQTEAVYVNGGYSFGKVVYLNTDNYFTKNGTKYYGNSDHTGILKDLDYSADVYLSGSHNSWAHGTADKFTDVAGTLTKSVSLTAGTVYTFKVVDNAWFGLSSTYLTDDKAGMTFSQTGGDVTLLAGITGSYTFTYNRSTHAVSVDYPAISHPSAGYAYLRKTWDHCHVHYWYNDGSDHVLTAWGSDPEVTTYTTLCDGLDYYYFPVLTTYNKLIGKDAAGDAGNGGNNKTSDMTSTSNGGKYISYSSGWAWRDVNYTVTYAAGTGGSGSMAASSTCHDTDVDLTACSFTPPTGKHFSHWTANVATTVGGSPVSAGSAIADEATLQDLASNVTLTAQWTPNQYSVTHSLTNMTTFSGATGANAATYGTNYVAVLNAAANYARPASVTVTCGATDITSSCTWVQATGTVTVPGASILGNITITAAGLTTYTVNYNKNDEGATGSVPSDASRYVNGATVTVKNKNTLAKSGYMFVGWRTGSSSGDWYAEGQKLTMGSGNVTLYAQWRSVSNPESGSVYSLTMGNVGTANEITTNDSVTLESYATMTNGTAVFVNKGGTDGKAQITKSNPGQLYFNGDAAMLKIQLGCALAQKDTIKFTVTDNNTNQLCLTTRNVRSTDTVTANLGDNYHKYYIVQSGDKFIGKSTIYVWRPTTSGRHVTAVSVVRPNPCEEADLAYATASVDKTYGDAVFTNPLTNSHNVTVTYESDDTDVATVNESTGAVTIAGVGTAHITASSTAQTVSSTKYCADETSYTLTVAKADLAGVATTGTATSVTHNSASLPYSITNVTGVGDVVIKVYAGESLIKTIDNQSIETSGSCSATGLSAETAYTYTVTLIGDANHNNKAETSKSTAFTTLKTPRSVTYSKGSATSGTAPSDATSYVWGDEVTVKDTTGCKFVYSGYTFRGWTDGTTFYKVGQTFRMPNENVTLTAVWDSYSSGGGSGTIIYKAKIKTGIATATIKALSEETNFTTDNYLSVLEGGTLKLHVTSTNQAEVSSNMIRLDNDAAYWILGLNTALQAGDIIKYHVAANTPRLQISSGDFSAATDINLEKSNWSTVVVPNGMVGASTLYLKRPGVNTDLDSIEIYRPGEVLLYMHVNDGLTDGNIDTDETQQTAGVSNMLRAVSGGEVYTGATTTAHLKIVGTNEIQLSGNTGYLKLVLPKALAAGDEIYFNSSVNYQISFTTSKSYGNSIGTAKKVYTIPGGSGLIGQNTIYVWYYSSSNATNVKTLAVVRPTGGGSGGWTNKYVAFKTNEGVVGTPTIPADTLWGVPSGKKIVQPADPTAVGYTYGGWYADAACTSPFSFTTPGMITKDTTIYAKFTAPTTLIEQPAKVDGKRVPMDTLDAHRHPEIDSVIVHQLIDPAPYGTCNISYKLCYSNHVQLDEQPVIHYGTGAGEGYDTVWMPMEQIQKYELVAYLRTGATRGEGDLVTTDTAIVSVENRWPIKVRYMKDGVELREPTQWYAYPSLKTTEAIRIPAERNGYILDSLEYGVGITVDSAKYIVYSGIEMYQVYLRSENAATVTAHYKVAPNTVYFFDTFEDPWYTPYIFDYGTTGYWGTGSDAGKGAGAEGHLGTHATRIDFMDRMYMMPIGASTTKLAIGSDEQKNADGTGFKYFYSRTYTPEGWDHSITVKPEIFYRTDFNQALPMFVPVVKSSTDYYVENTEARYFRGFWVKYSPDRDSTGYYLKVYDRVAVDGAQLIQSIPMTLAPTGEDGTWELKATMDLEGGKTYGFKYTKATGASTVDWYGNAGTMTSADHTDWTFTTGTNNCGLTTTSAGDYTFHLHCVNYGTREANAATDSEVQGKMVMTVDYATNEGDYRVVYVDDEQTNLTVGKSNVEPIASQTIRARANGQDTVTFYIRKDADNRSMKFQKFSAGAWSDVTGGTIALTNTTGQTFTVSKDTTYQIYIQQNEGGTSVEATGMDYYSGLYYIRTDCVDEHKWDYKQSMDAHSMVESDYASHLTTDPFTHYFVHWVAASKNVKFVVATQYSPTLTDTLITDAYANVAGGNLPSAGASVRFMYNKSTNAIKRAYLAGAQGGSLDPNFLKLTETSSSKMKNMSGSAITSITFGDLGNFTYQAEIQAQPGLTGKLTAEYNSQTQYFKGGPSTSETILGGTGLSWQHIVMTYDFKTNRLICAWTPGDTIDETLAINADIMIIRRGQRDAEQIVFKTNESKLTDVKYIYGVIQLDYNDLVGMMYSWDYWAYEHCMYYISFPFDVAVNDITGVGSIGKEWRIQRYNGAKRAEKGWFAGDGVTTFWEDVHAGDTLHAYEGYSLLLNRVRFNDSRNAIWENKTYGSSVYLFFPSLNATTGIVSDGEVTVKVPSHLCTIDRNFTNQNGVEVNHKNTDSHWNMMGTPLFENKTAFSIADNPIDPENPSSENIKYLYAWNSAGNTLGIQTTLNDTWQFKTMYSYMVQYAGDVKFKGSTINKSVAARRMSDSKNYHVNLELTKDELFVGRTYVELRENAVDSFLLNEDVYMVKNGVNADLYTYAGGYELGANVLTMDNHIVPVGIDVQKAGTYTFSMPSNFSGTVTLIDNFTQTRTNLAVDDYEIALPKGTINDRFELEININKTPTAIDGVDANQGALKDGKAHKFIENDQMYILKDGVLYDARGNRVK